jgi:hypothetical protein
MVKLAALCSLLDVVSLLPDNLRDSAEMVGMNGIDSSTRRASAFCN